MLPGILYTVTAYRPVQTAALRKIARPAEGARHTHLTLLSYRHEPIPAHGIGEQFRTDTPAHITGLCHIRTRNTNLTLLVVIQLRVAATRLPRNAVAVGKVADFPCAACNADIAILPRIHLRVATQCRHRICHTTAIRQCAHLTHPLTGLTDLTLLSLIEDAVPAALGRRTGTPAAQTVAVLIGCAMVISLALFPYLEHAVTAAFQPLLTQTIHAGRSCRTRLLRFALLSPLHQAIAASRYIDAETRLALLSGAAGMIALALFICFEHAVAAIAPRLLLTETIERAEVIVRAISIRLALLAALGIYDAVAAVTG